MATVIDISVLNSVTTVIVFLIIFVGGWGVLLASDPMKGKGKSFYGLISFLIALVVVLSKTAVSIILFSTPWLIIVGLVAFFLIFFAKMFGVGDSVIATAFENKIGWLIFFTALIVVFAIGTALGPDLLKFTAPGQATTTTVNGTAVPSTTASSDFGSNLALTLFHPKIIAVMFMFLLGTLTILLLN